MRRFLLLISAWTFSLSANSDFKVIPDQAKLPLLNPALQDQKTEKIELSNGLQAILVSDPHIKQSAIALTVMAGSWQEPDAFPGMAHFLEHMLFLGTSEYPDESSFTRFLTEHSGQTNAFTHGDYTSYMFALNSDGFKEGLKRFSSFFKTPLFSPSGVSRELNAIDQEFAQGMNNEGTREYFVLKHLASPLHPFSRFQTGNSKTLANATTEALRKWFEEHYSANIMHLYVLSSEPIEEIRKEVINDFSGIPNRNLAPFKYQESLFTEKTLGHLVRMAPQNSAQTLVLTWEIPSDIPPMLESRPADLLCVALGYEGKESLLAALKRENLAEALACGTLDVGSMTYLYSIEIQLTSKGVKEIDAVIQKVFQTIHLIGAQPFPEYLFNDYSEMLKQRYQFQQRNDPFEWAMTQAPQLAQEPIDTYPELINTLQVLNQEAIRKLLASLAPQNGIYLLVAPGQKLTKKEPWMQISYDIESIPEEKLSAWSKIAPSPEIKLPPKNPFIAREPKATKPIIDKDVYPLIPPPVNIMNSEGGSIFYSKDPFYQVPRSSLLMLIQTPEIKDGRAKSVVMAELYAKALKDALQDRIDEASNANLEVVIERGFGSIKVGLEGFTDSLIAFFPYLIPELQKLEVSEEKFQLFKESLQREYENNLASSPIKQAFDKMKSALFEHYTDFSKKRQAISRINYSEFQSFINRLFNKTYLKGTIIGSISEQEATKLIETLASSLKKGRDGDAKPYYPAVRALDPKEGPMIASFDTKAEGDALLLAIEMEPFTPENRNIHEMLSQAISEAFFGELRTKQQTGYIVFSDILETQKHAFSLFGVQSTTHTPKELLWRFELFIATYLNELSINIPEERFEALKNSLEKQLKTAPPSLKLYGEQLYKLAFEYENFNWYIERLENLKKLTYSQFLKASRDFLTRNNLQRLALSLQGQRRDAPPFEYHPYNRQKQGAK